LCNHAAACKCLASFHKKNERSLNDCMVYRGIHLIVKLYGMPPARIAPTIRLVSGYSVLGSKVDVKNLTECMPGIGGKGIGEGEAITVHAMGV